MLTEKRIARVLAEAGAEDPHASASAVSAAISEVRSIGDSAFFRAEWALERLCEAEPRRLARLGLDTAAEGIVREGSGFDGRRLSMAPLGRRRRARVSTGDSFRIPRPSAGGMA